MIIKRETLKTALHCSTANDSRYFLTGALVELDGRVVATNGHILVIVTDTSTIADDDFPHVNGHALAPLAEKVIVPCEIAKKMFAAQPKKSSIPVLCTSQIGVDQDGKTVIQSTDLNVPARAQLQTGADAPRFPDYARVLVPTERPHRKICLSAEVIEILAKIARDVADNKKCTCAVTLEIPTEDTHYRCIKGKDDAPDTYGELVSQIRFRRIVKGRRRCDAMSDLKRLCLHGVE